MASTIGHQRLVETMDAMSPREEELTFKVRFIERCWGGGRDLSQGDVKLVPHKRMMDHLQSCLNEIKRKRLDRVKTEKDRVFRKPTVFLRISSSQITMWRDEVKDEDTDRCSFPLDQVVAISQDKKDKRVFGIMAKGTDGYDVIGLKAFKGESKTVTIIIQALRKLCQ